jgi:hypothetical protein
MKTKLKSRFSITTILAIITALTLGSAALAGAAEKKNPPPPPRMGPQPGAIDPATGLPMASAPQWKDPEWKDPDKKLTVTYDGLPVEEVSADLRKQFNEAFDIVIPRGAQPANGAASFDAASVPIRIQLKNVTASELFNAMNLMFEAENTPLSWELKMNGSRPLVVLRVWPMFLPPPPSARPPERKIFFVGDMVGDEKTGGMTMEHLVKTVSDVYEMSYGAAHGTVLDHLQFHKEAQLLVVTGTIDEISFVMETLSALRQKVERSARVSAAGQGKAETKASTEKAKGAVRSE